MRYALFVKDFLENGEVDFSPAEQQFRHLAMTYRVQVDVRLYNGIVVHRHHKIQLVQALLNDFHGVSRDFIRREAIGVHVAELVVAGPTGGVVPILYTPVEFVRQVRHFFLKTRAVTGVTLKGFHFRFLSKACGTKPHKCSDKEE